MPVLCYQSNTAIKFTGFFSSLEYANAYDFNAKRRFKTIYTALLPNTNFSSLLGKSKLNTIFTLLYYGQLS